MKKLFIVICAVILSTAVYADDTKTCKVSGTDGSVEMSINVKDPEKGICIISFSNDTDRNVNVRYEVSCGNKRIPGSKLVYANSEQVQEISFNHEIYDPSTVTIKSLSGQKCN